MILAKGFLVILVLSFPRATTSKAQDLSNNTRHFKDGDIIIGALLTIHVQVPQNGAICEKFDIQGFGFTQVLAYAIDKINKDINLLPNITLGYDIRDYCNYPLLAVQAAYDFVSGVPGNRVAAVVGPQDSSTALKIVGLLHVKNVPLISFAASSEELSEPMFSNFFRTIPPDINQAKALADLVDYFDWKYVAAVAVDDSYGRYGIRGLADEADKRSTFCIAFTEYITPTGYQNRIRDIVTRLKKEENIKVIILWGTEEPSKRFLDEAVKQKLTGKTFLLSDSLATNERLFFEKYASVLDGCLGAVPYYDAYVDYSNFMRQATPRNTRGSKLWNELWEHEFSCSFANKSKRPCDVHGNQTMSNKTFDSMYNAFSAKLVDSVYAIAHALHKAYGCTSGTSSQVGSCPKFKNHVDPLLVTRFLESVNFLGLSGTTRFDSIGNPIFSWYNIINAQKEQSFTGNDLRYETRVVGIWKDKRRSKSLNINRTVIKWNKNNNDTNTPPESICSNDCPPGTKRIMTSRCCWKCIGCEDAVSYTSNSGNCTKCDKKQKPNENRTECIALPFANIGWSSTVAIVLLSLSAFGLLLSIGSFVVFLRSWNTPIIKASNRELSSILIAAIAIFFVLAILYLDLPTPVLCMILSPLRYVMYSVCVTVLFLKTARILHAFQMSSQRRNSTIAKKLIQGKSSICGVILVNTVQSILSICSIIIDPPVVEENVRPGEYIILGCMPYRSSIGRGLHLTMLLYLLVLIIISTTYSFKARKIPENYNEGRCIVFSLYIIILSWVVYYPVDLALDGWYVAIISNASTLLSSYGLLFCIFFPKLYIIFFHPEQNTLEYARAQITKHNMRSRTSTGLTTLNAAEPINNTDKSATATPELCSEIQDTSRNHVMPFPLVDQLSKKI